MLVLSLRGFLLLLVTVATATAEIPSQNYQRLEDFDVVIAGGTTAAYAAAITAAQCGARTALLEPTDWVGGQLTASGVPAVDEAWHSVKSNDAEKTPYSVARQARNPLNISPCFLSLMQNLEQPADCWVSRFCFRPDVFVEKQLEPLQRQVGSLLTIFLDTVVKRIELDSDEKRIRSLTAIRRTPKTGIDGYDRLPSQDLADWYSPQPSKRFDKEGFIFEPGDDTQAGIVFIEATEWGEILALSGMRFLQGVEDSDGATSVDKANGRDTCGQATVYCFVQRFHEEPQQESDPKLPVGNLGFGGYREKPDPWNLIWTYRRVQGEGDPGPGDLCLQNWGYYTGLEEGGNDYPFGYLFKSIADARAEVPDWRGGIDLDSMAAAEQRALAWHFWFKNNAPEGVDPAQVTLDSSVLGTRHGLAKLPYIRDTRRAIGLDDYVLTFADLTGPAEQQTGTKFDDRIALGAYPADVHALATCKMPAYVTQSHDTLPFYIPFRALTHYQLENLLTAGKTMAQSFLANSATRLHPIEWSTGTAAGVAAAYMARTGKSTREAYENIDEVQGLIREYTPVDWVIEAAN